VITRRLLARAALAATALGLSGQAQAADASAATRADAGSLPAASCTTPWPMYQTFLDRFLQADGRVIDPSVPQQHTTSEGQSYGMMFALVANDPVTFDRLWRWSVANLAGGDIASRLPAWQWGLKPDGSWGVLDPNAASDADLWYAYALLEAGRVWKREDYLRDARTLMTRVAREEVADLPGLGKMLLPGPMGFQRSGPAPNAGTPGGAPSAITWRLNPSYMPVPVLRRLAAEDRQGPWAAIASATAKLVTQSSPKGYVPDWVGYTATPVAGTDATAGTVVVDPDKGDVGSYDAIRTYLWAGMTPPADPLAGPMLRALSGMTAGTTPSGTPPESARALTGAVQGTGPVGFSAALLPYFTANGQTRLLAAQRDRVQAQFFNPALPPQAMPRYYDYVLGLFGTGWAEQRYRFLTTGNIQLRWETACPRATTR
jgi:endoglucanase